MPSQLTADTGHIRSGSLHSYGPNISLRIRTRRGWGLVCIHFNQEQDQEMQIKRTAFNACGAMNYSG